MKLKVLVIGLLLVVVMLCGGCKLGSLVDEGYLTEFEENTQGNGTRLVVVTLEGKDGEQEHTLAIPPEGRLIFRGWYYEEQTSYVLGAHYYLYGPVKRDFIAQEGRIAYTLSMHGLP